MATLINVSASLVSSLGTVSLSSANDNNTLEPVGTTATAVATTMSVSGVSGIEIKTKAAEVDQTKSYVQSLTAEEQQRLSFMLDAKEIEMENKKVYQLKK